MGNVAFREPADIPVEDRAAVFDGAPPSLEAVAKLITTGRARNIVVLVGAGASVSAGIPDFRSPGTGLYDNLQKYNLPEGSPESVFDIDYFKSDPSAFFALAKELYPGRHAPTPTHHLLALLHSKGLLRRIYTQNIDGLERLAGLPEDLVVPCHGSFDRAHCIACGAEAPPAEVKATILAGGVPRCVRAAAEGGGTCDGLCKPAIVFFGEKLPASFASCRDADLCMEVDPRTAAQISDAKARREAVQKRDLRASWGLLSVAEKTAHEAEKRAVAVETEAAKSAMIIECACDVLLVFGTSLKVAPVSGIPDQVHWLCPRVLINREIVHAHGEPAPEWPPRSEGEDNGFRFALEDNYRDVLVQRDCDDAAWELATLLGWRNRLQAVVDRGGSVT